MRFNFRESMTNAKRLIGLFIGLGFCSVCLAAGSDYQITVDVVEQEGLYKTNASFALPLKLCQAYKYITDYDAAKNIPGVVSSTSTRMDTGKVRVERLLQERILFFPLRFHMVLEVTELHNKGTNFVQTAGEAKSYKGSWRLEEVTDTTVFRYLTESQPDSIWPKAVVQYFIKNRLASSFEAMAAAGLEYRLRPC
jgi:hypothetical protein